MPENSQYEFRVKAVNSAGPGEPSLPSDPVLIQDQPGRPVIDMSKVKDITVKAGEDFTIKIPYSGGQPKPIADFFNDGREVFPDGERITVEVKRLQNQIN